jgi:pimeloyl-ACP methyl ester carboxylesterase
LHGSGQTRQAWQTQGYSDRLRKQFTVIAVDLRGSGDSGRPMSAEAYAIDRVLADLIAVADAAGAKRFHVWGHGHGATIARYLAARSPDRVSAAVIVSASMGPAVSGVFKTAVTAMRDKWRPIIDAQAAGKLDTKTLTASDKTAWDTGIASSVLSLGALLDYPPVEPSDIKVPTLWIVGADDVEGAENVKQYEGKLKGTPVTVKTLNSVSYSDSFIKIDPVMAEVEPFLAKVSAAQTTSQE